jgi:hypothetical protein
MAKTYNLARMSTLTTGAGTITLGSAISGYLTFALAGVSNGDVVAYGISDGANSETGIGTYTSAGTTLTRTVTSSTNGGAAINLSGSAQVYVTARKEDLLMMLETQAVNTLLAGPSSGGAAAPTFRALSGLDMPSGGHVLLNTLTASNSANLQDTTSLTATYDRYELVFYDIISITNAVSFNMTVHEAGTFPVTAYLNGGRDDTSAGGTAVITLTTAIALTDGALMGNGAATGYSGRVQIFNPAGTATPKKIMGQASHLASDGTMRGLTINGFWNGTTAVDGFSLQMSSGNISSGKVKVYGIIS